MAIDHFVPRFEGGALFLIGIGVGASSVIVWSLARNAHRRSCRTGGRDRIALRDRIAPLDAAVIEDLEAWLKRADVGP